MNGKSRRFGLSRVALASAIAAFGNSASAGDIKLGDEITGTWTLNASLGTNVRMQGRDPALTSFGNANHNGGRPGTGGGSTDDGDLNFNRGDITSTTLKLVGDVELRHRNYGALVRAKAWHDFTLATAKVPHGNFDNGYTPDQRLNDSHFDSAAKFSGAELLDAFVYGDWALGDESKLNLRLGNQVVNWGESIFTQGVNVANPIDVPAARRAGAQVREILLPVPMLYGNLGLPGGVSVEAFYQLRWKKTVIDGCGTFFSPADAINCGGSQFGPDVFSDLQQYQGVAALGGLNLRSVRQPDAKPSNAGQYGLALHWLEPSSETDVGLYFINYHARTPSLSLSSKPSEASSLYGSVAPLSYLLDYSAENIKTYGISLSNTLGGVSVMAELSYTQDLPVQVNGGDLVQFGVSGGTQGPLVGKRTYDPAGATIRGYDRMDKVQLLFGAINVFSQVLGAQSLLTVGEVGMSWVPNLPNAQTDVRYGRAFTFGTAWHQAYTSPALSTSQGCSAANMAGMVSPANCAQDGFVTPFSWGYRLLGELEYPNAVAGWTAKPRVYWAHDVRGHAADGAFLENRRTLGTGLALSRLEKGRRWTFDLAYTRFIDSARWDTNRDKDFLAASLSVAF